MSILDIELVGSPGARRSTASRITSPGTITYSRSAAIGPATSWSTAPGSGYPWHRADRQLVGQPLVSTPPERRWRCVD